MWPLSLSSNQRTDIIMALAETAYYIMINSQVGSKSNFIQDIKIKKRIELHTKYKREKSRIWIGSKLEKFSAEVY